MDNKAIDVDLEFLRSVYPKVFSYPFGDVIIVSTKPIDGIAIGLGKTKDLAYSNAALNIKRIKKFKKGK